jgi:peptidoglycan/xylan/chitin deacetylase (PgdA/CDA1 family)
MVVALVAAWIGLGCFGVARAASCDNAEALGTSRVLTVDPAEHALLGTMQYPGTLPLADHEVVLTFDDGPLPRYTNPILDILASQCVRATFFMVGQMAQAFPATARRVAAEGHTVGTHSQDHPFHLARMPQERARAEIDDGFNSVSAALGDTGHVAPFFRFPGLLHPAWVEQYLAERHIVTFSSDVVGDDWKHHIRPSDIVKRTMQRLETKGRGILLLHDIHAVTVKALPDLLHELKAHGYRVVHIVPMQTMPPPAIAPAPTPAPAEPQPETPAFWARSETIKIGILDFGPPAGVRQPLFLLPD